LIQGGKEMTEYNERAVKRKQPGKRDVFQSMNPPGKGKKKDV